jgi:hypothetical protein
MALLRPLLRLCSLSKEAEIVGTPPPRPQFLLYWYKSTDTDAADGAGSPPPRPQALLGAVVFEWGSIKALLRLY